MPWLLALGMAAGAAIECGQTKGPMITKKVSHKKKLHTHKKEHRRSQQDLHTILSQAHLQDLDPALAMKNEPKAKEVRIALCAIIPSLNTYRKNPSVWTHCLVIQTNA